MRIVSTVLWLVACVALAPARARACKCGPAPDPTGAAHAAAAVLEGQVSDVALRASADGASYLEVSVAVVRTWKGVQTERLTLRTNAESASCGYAFAKGESYLIYADAEGKEGAPLRVSSCSRTRLVVDADADLAALGMGVVPVDMKAQPPKPGAAPKTTPVVPPSSGGCASCAAAPRPASGGAAIAVLALAAWLARRRRLTT